MLFNATVTLTTIETRCSTTQGDYTYAKAQLHKKDGSTRDGVTIMSFGPNRMTVLDQFEAGRKITVHAVWDDHVLKILGPAKVYQRARRQSKTGFTGSASRRKTGNASPAYRSSRTTAASRSSMGDRSKGNGLFQATVLLNNVETRTSATKGDYTYAKGRLVRRDGYPRPVTVMAFGPQRASVIDELVSGHTIKVCVTWDDRVLKIIGPARTKLDTSSPDDGLAELDPAA
ncbi:hypothetical protein WBP06_18280 (plasmid) [Novosphingobium sp. BL-8H]|uniref:hypothetical protein n=1 Tax=Novosphingobium sp. BL-8H TaxID=3127640 RepID=UPI003757B452